MQQISYDSLYDFIAADLGFHCDIPANNITWKEHIDIRVIAWYISYEWCILAYSALCDLIQEHSVSKIRVTSSWNIRILSLIHDQPSTAV